MTKKIRLSLVFIIFMIQLPIAGQGQSKDTSSSWLQQKEKQLNAYLDTLANATSEMKRIQINDKILDTLREVVKQPGSFEYSFDSIENAGILQSEDNKLKLYNWNLPYNDGTHDYYCLIQYKADDDNGIKIFELKDKSGSIEEPESAILNYPEWYGALYYNIIPIKSRKNETYYTLLAYDMNDYLTDKKIVDILRFDEENKPVFGASIFKNRREVSNRLIFEYGEFASMMLKYDKEKEIIVYDHLSPSKAEYEGQREYYGPDFSYDGLKYENGIWNTYFDLDLRRNEININQ
ncbi:MAG: hypothetical protein ACOCQ8_00875 [Bacteroidia bacterium]